MHKIYSLLFRLCCCLFQIAKKNIIVLKVSRWMYVNVLYGYPTWKPLWITTDWYCRTIIHLISVKVDLGCSLAWLWNYFLAQKIWFLPAWAMHACGCLQSWLKPAKFSHDFQNYFQCSSFILFIRTIGTWLLSFTFFLTINNTYSWFLYEKALVRFGIIYT